jgi:hypothetical protein
LGRQKHHLPPSLRPTLALEFFLYRTPAVRADIELSALDLLLQTFFSLATPIAKNHDLTSRLFTFIRFMGINPEDCPNRFFVLALIVFFVASVITARTRETCISATSQR